MVEHQGKILLCKRGIEPCKGKWTLPAGFLELHESTAGKHSGYHLGWHYWDVVCCSGDFRREGFGASPRLQQRLLVLTDQKHSRMTPCPA